MKRFVLILAVLLSGCGVAINNPAQAAETTVINFSCDGKLTSALTSDAKPELIYNVGLVVNFVEKTVSFAGFVAPFVKVDAANISFNGVNNTPLSERGPAVSISVYGNIDRITGAVEATTASTALTSY